MRHIILSIRKPWADAIIDGRKTLEVRKTRPDRGVRVFMYESKAGGGSGAIVGWFDMPGVVNLWGAETDETCCKTCLTEAQLKKYATGGRRTNWLWRIEKPHRLTEPVALEAIHMDRPPQSWQYIDQLRVAELMEIIEKDGRQNEKK